MDWWKKKKKKKARAYYEKQRLIRDREIGALLLEDLIQCCDGKSNPIKFFCGDQILEATDNFSKSNHVFELYDYAYEWYSGKNENHPMLLIKRVVHPFYVKYLEYVCRDIAISSMVSGHKNFLKLVGCCLEFQEPVMVFQGVKKHYRLDLHTEQPWKKRMKIAEGIATALAYLHTAFPRPFVYRNMSLGNILLDEDGVAKLCDFFECISIPQGETFVHVDRLVGVYGFMDHNYLNNGVVSEKTDLFAIGIVMQKLLTGTKRFEELSVEEGEGDGYETKTEMNVPRKKFPKWLSKSMEERIMEDIADPKMLEKMGDISEEELFRMKAFLVLSQRCIGLRGEVPTMVEVAKELRKIQRSL